MFAAAVQTVSVDLTRVAADLDLERRLREIPQSACSRGVFFNMVRDDLRRRNLLGLPEVGRLLRAPRKSYRFYPTRDLIEVFALGGAIVDADPREGMRKLFAGGSQYFASTWFGHAMARFLRPDPASALAWIERSREYFANYGRWRLERRGPEHAILHMFDEYLYLEAAHRGGCEGLLVACGVSGEVRAELDSDYSGRLDIRWQLR
jgi:uncharacterized protein (TIGR02265 family)